MDQVFEGTPKAVIKISGRKLSRSDVTHDWGSKLQWQISRDGKVVSSVTARPDLNYEHPDKAPGKYEVVLQLFKYINYRKDKQGAYTQSKFIDISNKVSYTISK